MSLKIVSHKLVKNETNETSNMNAIVHKPSNSNSNNTFQNAIFSTASLVSTLSKSMFCITFYPLLKPIQITSFMITSSLSFIQRSTMSFAENLLFHSNLLLSNSNNYENDERQRNIRTITHDENQEINSNHQHSQNNDGNSSNLIQDVAFNTVPIIYNTTQEIIGLSLSFFFGNGEKDEGGEVESVIGNEVMSDGEKNYKDGHMGTNIIIQQDENEIESDNDDDYIPLIYDDLKEQQQDEGNRLVNEQHGVIDPTALAISKSEEVILKDISKIDNEIDSDSEKKIEHEKTHPLTSKMGHDDEVKQNQPLSPPFYIRVCDLNIYPHDHLPIDQISLNDEKKDASSQSNNSTHQEEKKHDDTSREGISTSSNSTKEKLVFLELQQSIKGAAVLTSHHMNLVQLTNTLVQMGVKLAMGGGRSSSQLDILNNEVSWKSDSSTAKRLKRFQTSNTNGNTWFTNDEVVESLEKDVLLWSGNLECDMTEEMTYGHKIPLFRGRGIIPSMGPRKLTELLLDSSKVKLYNKFSSGRVDSAIFQNDLDLINGPYGSGCTKIVSSETNVPFSSKKLKMENLFHARSIVFDDAINSVISGDDDHVIEGSVRNAYIIVSRSVQREQEPSNQQSHAKQGSKNEIIWGINILRDIPGHPDKTDLITVTQANTSVVPNFLSHKVRTLLYLFKSELKKKSNNFSTKLSYIGWTHVCW